MIAWCIVYFIIGFVISWAIGNWADARNYKILRKIEQKTRALIYKQGCHAQRLEDWSRFEQGKPPPPYVYEIDGNPYDTIDKEEEEA